MTNPESYSVPALLRAIYEEFSPYVIKSPKMVKIRARILARAAELTHTMTANTPQDKTATVIIQPPAITENENTTYLLQRISELQLEIVRLKKLNQHLANKTKYQDEESFDGGIND